jgi:hypothetical protein
MKASIRTDLAETSLREALIYLYKEGTQLEKLIVAHSRVPYAKAALKALKLSPELIEVPDSCLHSPDTWCAIGHKESIIYWSPGA